MATQTLEHVPSLLMLVNCESQLVILTPRAQAEFLNWASGSFARDLAELYAGGPTVYALCRRWDYADGVLTGLRES